MNEFAMTDYQKITVFFVTVKNVINSNMKQNIQMTKELRIKIS